ncbi:hypothetical protein KKC44_05560 [Patescibacteria group bacterium]|nr:hypothetical protein [Patescibacteria group bacterium]
MGRKFREERPECVIPIQITEEPSNDPYLARLVDKFNTILTILDAADTITITVAGVCDRLSRLLRLRLRRSPLIVSGPDAREAIRLFDQAVKIIGSKPRADPYVIDEWQRNIHVRARLLEEKITTGKVVL